ncbi:MAG TPA: tRNA dihydrouridine synthase DusB [Acidimicrobiales bacterium]|nr:tRNA dihydrouridine synthase DusB [Acidimicrobiales bacterium]
MKIGPIDVDPPVVLAPMAGVTNAAFRRLCRRHGAGLYVSEMVAARALVEANPKTMRMVAFPPDESPRSVQLYAVDPAVAGSAVRVLVDEVGVDHVDLNFGCPAAKVTRKGGGAALPVRRALLRSIVRAAVGAAGGVPVTVKMRLGVDDAHRTATEAARVCEDEGAAAVAIHARTAQQLYAGPADWAAIAEVKQVVRSIPVLGNGDIWEADDAIRMVAETGCDGVVVGRGCLGRPWIFRDLADRFAGRPATPAPSLGEITGMMRLHLNLLIDLLGPDLGPRDFRKHTGWYLAGFPVGPERRRMLSQLSSADELDELLAPLDPSTAFPPAARRLVRGHSSGPRPVSVPPGWFDDVDDPTPPADAGNAVSGG